MENDIIKRNFKYISPKYKEFCLSKDNCRSCGVFNYYEKIVHSEGNANNPTFVIVAEAPGRVEVEKCRPMAGTAGQEMRKSLRKFGFTRENTLLTNVMPCRPEDNRFPNDWAIVSKCYHQWLLKEIKILRPKVIILCGAHALRALGDKTGIGRERGRWFFLFSLKAWTIATWHPSYVLRCQNDPNKRNVPIEFKNDLKKVSIEWFNIVHNDRRISMSKAEYNKTITKKLLQQHQENIS